MASPPVTTKLEIQHDGPNRGGRTLYLAPSPWSGLYGANMLPGFRLLVKHPQLEVVYCEKRGLTRFLAKDAQRHRLAINSS